MKLKEVNEVFIFNESTPLNLIKIIKPNYIFKGSDYKNKKVSGHNFIKKYGGKLILINILKNYSTTEMIKKN